MIAIKQLKSGNKVFFPQTIAEAVIVQDEQGISTLEQTLQRKIEHITSTEELSITKENGSIEITHSGNIEPNEVPEPLLVQHDNKGHIVYTKPYGKIYVKVMDETHKTYSGTDDVDISFGDDFQIQDDNITLRWNNI